MFGYTITKKKYLDELVENNTLLEERNTFLVDEYKDIEAEVDKLKQVKSPMNELIDVDAKDPVPENQQERREYVARVAAFYADILKKKMIHMISNFHNVMEEETNDRDSDFVLKSGVYVCREFMRWGESMIAEQIANQVEASEQAEESKKDNTATEIKTQINSALNQN